MHYVVNNAGALVEVSPGSAFDSYQLKIMSEADAVGVPDEVEVGDIVAHVLPHPSNWHDGYTPFDMERYVIHQVEVGDEPDLGPGESVSGCHFELIEGVATKAWDTTTLSLADFKAQRRAEAIAYCEEQRQTEFPWNFGVTVTKDDEGNVLGTAGAQTLQMRTDGDVNDQDNWRSVAIGAIAAILSSAPTSIQPMKTTANVWVQTTALDVVHILIGGGAAPSAFQRGLAQLGRIGALKKAIENANSLAAVAAIDVTAGWPS